MDLYALTLPIIHMHFSICYSISRNDVVGDLKVVSCCYISKVIIICCCVSGLTSFLGVTKRNVVNTQASNVSC